MVSARRSNPSSAFWAGKRVLLTGHTGFKGGWLALWLARLGARTTGIALPPNSRPDLFSEAAVAAALDHQLLDIRDCTDLQSAVVAADPDIVLHLAAQPLVRASYRDPAATFATNVQGTANLLEALRSVERVRAIVIVTTDKVYRNLESLYPYREDDRLGGHDPYSASKAAAEIVTASYRDCFFAPRGVGVVTARAGNVIGGGDWSEDRLLPDAVRAWLRGEPLSVRNPGSTRPWQHVLEPLSAYLLIAERLAADPNFAGGWNFGPEPSEAAPVRQVVELASAHFKTAPVRWADNRDGPQEAGWLALETVKARLELGIRPRWGLEEAVKSTSAWYRAHADGADARALCDADIEAFEASA